MFLQLVRGLHLRLNPQSGLRRHCIGIDNDCFRLETEMALTVVSHLDIAPLSGSDRLTWKVTRCATATLFDASDDKRCITIVDEMEGVRHYLTLQNFAEICVLLKVNRKLKNID